MSTTELLTCPFCGGEVGIALHSSKFGEYWWAVQRGRDDAAACKCRLFMESDRKFSLEEGEEPEDSPRAMELRTRLVEKWNRRVVIDVDGERHEFGADSLIRLLEGYEGARDASRYAELFGTPERAAETAWRLLMCHITTRCDECPMGDGCDISTNVYCDDGEAALLEWLRGDA